MYGILHDQVTIRVCPEYFTIFHPRIFPTESLTLIALGWGVVATWWVGLPLGIMLAVVCRARAWPKLDARELITPIAILLTVMFACAALAGLAGYFAMDCGLLRPWPWLSRTLPPEKHAAFFADLAAHNASYWSGALGGVVLGGWALVERGRRAVADTRTNRIP